MENKKLKKGSSVTELFVVIVIAAFLAIGIYSFAFKNANDTGVNIPQTYNDTFNAYSNAQSQINNLTTEMRGAIGNVTEADNVVQIAWNGFTGMVLVFKLPLKMYDIASSLFQSAINSTDWIPDNVKTTVTIIILILVVFTAVAFFIGRDRA